jgi:RHS repeat-associated protein
LDFGRGSFYPEFRGVQPQTLTHRYLHGAVVDQIFAREDVESLWQPGDVLWALTDHLGTVRDVIDSMATVVNHIRYDSFGKITSETNAAVDFLFAYTGRERDEETGLYYYRARYYDPAVGRFVSEDPMGFAAGDTNLVRYVGNNVTVRTDPSGMIRRGDPFGLPSLVLPADFQDFWNRILAIRKGPGNMDATSDAYKMWYWSLISRWYDNSFNFNSKVPKLWSGPPHMDATLPDFKVWYAGLIFAQFPPPPLPPPQKPGLPFGIPGYIDINIGFIYGGGVQTGSRPPGPFRRFPSLHWYWGMQTPNISVTWSPFDITPGLNYGFSVPGIGFGPVFQFGPVFPRANPRTIMRHWEVGIGIWLPGFPGAGVWLVQ